MAKGFYLRRGHTRTAPTPVAARPSEREKTKEAALILDIKNAIATKDVSAADMHFRAARLKERIEQSDYTQTPNIFVLYAQLRLQMGDKQEASAYAQRCYDILIKSDDPSASFAHETGLLLKKCGRTRQAIHALERGHKAAPTNISLINTLATLLHVNGQTPRALTLLESAHRREPGNMHIANTRGIILHEAGQTDAALAVLLRAQHSNPNDIHILTTLGNVFHDAGQPGKAKKVLEQARTLPQHDRAVIHTLASIYADTKDEDSLRNMLPLIPKTELRDYFLAKFFYTTDQQQKVIQLLQPHLENDNFHPALAGLFMACLPDESPVRSIMKKILGEERFQGLANIGDQWRADPRRFEQRAIGYFSTGMSLFELGANPVNADTRRMTTTPELPVHIRRSAPL